MARYLTNSTSEQSAGWYPDDVARVLLADGFSDWSEAEPPDESTELDLSLLNPLELRQHEAVQAGHVLTEVELRPELAPQPPVAAVNEPDPGPAPVPVEDPPSADPTPGGTAELEGN